MDAMAFDVAADSPACELTSDLTASFAVDAVMSNADLVALILVGAPLRARAVAAAVNSLWAAEARPLAKLGATWDEEYLKRFWSRDMASGWFCSF